MPPSDAPVRPFLTALRDRWWIVALCVVVSAGLASSAVRQQPGLYEGGAVLRLQNQNLDRDIFQLSPSLKSTEQTLAEQPGQLDTLPSVVELTRQLGLQPAIDARQLASRTSVELDPKYYLPVVYGRDADARRAALIANTYARVIVARRARSDRRRLSAAIAATQSRLEEVARGASADRNLLERRATRTEVERLSGQVLRLQLLREFRPPTVSVARWSPVPSRRTRAPASVIATVAGVFGLMMGCALLGRRERRDRRPRAGQVLADVRAAILTDLPRSALLPGARPSGPFPGELAALDAVRRVLRADEPRSVVAVTEAVSLGRAGAAARLLAETAVLRGSRALLASNDPRLAEGEQPDGLVVARYPAEIGAVSGEWVAEQRAAFDLVIIDLPSPVGSAAALEFASLADRVLVVWVADSVTRSQLARLGRTLRRAGVVPDGVVRVGGQAA